MRCEFRFCLLAMLLFCGIISFSSSWRIESGPTKTKIVSFENLRCAAWNIQVCFRDMRDFFFDKMINSLNFFVKSINSLKLSQKNTIINKNSGFWRYKNVRSQKSQRNYKSFVRIWFGCDTRNKRCNKHRNLWLSPENECKYNQSWRQIQSDNFRKVQILSHLLIKSYFWLKNSYCLQIGSIIIKRTIRLSVRFSQTILICKFSIHSIPQNLI